MSKRALRVWLTLTVGLWLRGTPGLCGDDDSPLQLVPPVSATQQGGGVAASPAVDSLHDIRGPVPVPEWSDSLWWLGLGLAVIGVCALLVYFFRRRKKVVAQLFAHEIALRDLRRLQAMMNAEQALDYAARLSEILRRYLEARFQIAVTRRTTREFFSDLAGNPQAANSMDGHADTLRKCLEQCDMAKFACCVPGLPEMEAMERAVRAYIEATGQPALPQGKG